jgi:rhamnogalacturonan endolyase
MFSFRAISTVAALGMILWGALRPAIAADEPKATGPDVTLTEDDANYTLANGTVTAIVAKGTGDLISLQYKGLETIYRTPERVVGAAFTQKASQGTGVAARITIDPKTTNGDRAEVSVKGTNITALKTDMEFRFCMGRGESGIYTYCIYDHPADYPAQSWGESRWVARVADFFDWTGEDHGRELVMREVPQAMDGIRYTFAGSWFDHRSYGWASPAKKVGFWLINPSVEYIGGGPTKTDFLTHRDTNAAAPPCILLFSKSNHFGGGSVVVGAGEHWSKVIGPFFLYVNSGPDPLTMWKDAEALARKETAKWPYEWVKGVDYVQGDQLSSVKGQLVLSDPQMPGARMSNVRVGLAHAPYVPPAVQGRGGGSPAGGRDITWFQDAKFYQFWTLAQDDGTFTIPNVIAGNYTLYAVADGVLGEFSKAEIAVEAGKPIDLGKLTWTPVRRGKQIWEIGIPNRNAREYTYGDKYFDYESQSQYARLFPNDVNFVIGKSNVASDWFYQQLPHATADSPPAAPARGGRGAAPSGRATPYNIRFEMPAASKGKATLRVAICGGGARQIDVTVNDQPAGQIPSPGGADVITRHGIQGPWSERDVEFDAALLKQGSNVLTLTVPAGPINSGVLYDYLRLEVDETASVAQ